MANLTLVKSEDELVQKALNGLVELELGNTAGNLQTARQMWRQHRELVEAAEFPEYLRGPFVAVYGFDPNDDDSDCGQLDPAVVREEELPAAHEMARGWMERAWTEATNGQPLEIV